jgi:prepilin-type N-terminal cleavage/methylation domain-containing protein
MQSRISIHLPDARRGFTLIEAMVSIVVVSMVASAGALAVGVSSATQQESQLAQLATQAAQQQLAYLLEKPYDSMSTYAGTEEVGRMLAPPAGGGVDRTTLLTGTWSKLGRRTTLVNEPFTFTQYAGFVVEGTSIRVEVFGPDGTVYASVQRHRSKESGT